MVSGKITDHTVLVVYVQLQIDEFQRYNLMSKISSVQILNWDGLDFLLIRSDIDFLLKLFIKKDRKYSICSVFFVTDSLQNRLPHPDRPKCNSILHLIGSWLFEAAFIGSEYSKHPSSDQVAPIVNDGHKISVPSLSPKPVITWSPQLNICHFNIRRFSFMSLLNCHLIPKLKNNCQKGWESKKSERRAAHIQKVFGLNLGLFRVHTFFFLEN